MSEEAEYADYTLMLASYGDYGDIYYTPFKVTGRVKTEYTMNTSGTDDKEKPQVYYEGRTFIFNSWKPAHMIHLFKLPPNVKIEKFTEAELKYMIAERDVINKLTGTTNGNTAPANSKTAPSPPPPPPSPKASKPTYNSRDASMLRPVLPASLTPPTQGPTSP